jgi:hypothetical protein
MKLQGIIKGKFLLDVQQHLSQRKINNCLECQNADAVKKCLKMKLLEAKRNKNTL